MVPFADTRPVSRKQAGGRVNGTVVFVVTEDWYFVSHRLPMARAVRDLGFHVVVATRIWNHRATIEAEGFEVAPIAFRRASLNPFSELSVSISLLRLFRRCKPIIVHCVALKPIVDAGLAAALCRNVVVVNAFAGMGSVLGDVGQSSVLQRLVATAIRLIARANRAYAVVQNVDDYRHVVAQGFALEAHTRIIRGSGVDVRHFSVRPEPDGPVVAMMVSRLLWDKGIGEFIAAAEILRNRGVDLRFRVVGDRDPANPKSIDEPQLETWKGEQTVEFLGRREDIGALWADAHIAVLPSYREGLPKSLLEAAACGRPIATTDTTGCRDLVPNGNTGILVPAGDPVALANALQQLAEDPERRVELGRNARALIEQVFSEEQVVEATQTLYRQLAACR